MTASIPVIEPCRDKSKVIISEGGVKPARPKGHVTETHAGAKGKLSLKSKATEVRNSRSQVKGGGCHQ